jgi:hypothetical protein
MSQPHLSKKEKKKLQNKKNRYHQQLFELVRLRRVEAERVEELEEAKKPRRDKEGRVKNEDEDPIWSEKLATIRNRIDGRKRESKERWNRFAGTGDAGARGL